MSVGQLPRPPMIILAGGKGTRLGDLTKNTQKCMIEIEGKPFLAHLIDWYRKQGFTDFTIATGYLAEQVEEYDFGPGVVCARDPLTATHERWFRAPLCWVVNGDTWIKNYLPTTCGFSPIVVNQNGIDAGAHFIGTGKTILSPCEGFFDIGTPSGLESFKRYFHDINKSAT